MGGRGGDHEGTRRRWTITSKTKCNRVAALKGREDAARIWLAGRWVTVDTVGWIPPSAQAHSSLATLRWGPGPRYQIRDKFPWLNREKKIWIFDKYSETHVKKTPDDYHRALGPSFISIGLVEQIEHNTSHCGTSSHKKSFKVINTYLINYLPHSLNTLPSFK